MNKVIIRALCCVGAAVMAFSCGNKKKAAQKAAEAAEIAIKDSLEKVEMEEKARNAEATIALLDEEPVFDIVTNLGTIKVKLYSKTPKHRYNFEKLALTGYYDGLLFHRVIKDFMIQGGDPYTRDTAMVAKYGQGGPAYTVPAEFVPEYKHKKGALAAARRGDAANPKKESSGSQFYIVQNPQTCAQLDGEYTVFGETIDGLDVIDKIADVTTNRMDLPVSPVKIISVRLDKASEPTLPVQASDTSAVAAADSLKGKVEK